MSETHHYFLFATIVVLMIWFAIYEPAIKPRPIVVAPTVPGEILWDCDLQSLTTRRGEIVADCVAQR